MQTAGSGEKQPMVLTQSLNEEDPRDQVSEIAAAVHEYVRVHRQRPRFLVMHPDDHARVSPHLRQAPPRDLAKEQREEPLTERVHAALDPRAIVLSDTEDPAWETPHPGTPRAQ